jgi:hypothetical protein
MMNAVNDPAIVAPKHPARASGKSQSLDLSHFDMPQ